MCLSPLHLGARQLPGGPGTSSRWGSPLKQGGADSSRRRPHWQGRASSRTCLHAPHSCPLPDPSAGPCCLADPFPFPAELTYDLTLLFCNDNPPLPCLGNFTRIFLLRGTARTNMQSTPNPHEMPPPSPPEACVPQMGKSESERVSR